MNATKQIGCSRCYPSCQDTFVSLLFHIFSPSLMVIVQNINPCIIPTQPIG